LIPTVRVENSEYDSLVVDRPPGSYLVGCILGLVQCHTFFFQPRLHFRQILRLQPNVTFAFIDRQSFEYNPEYGRGVNT
jgi:hypothetical protein